MATSSAITKLRGTRFGRRERALLLAAPGPDPTRPERSAEGMMPVIETTRSGRVAAHRAAARLNDLGLIDYRKKIRDDRRVYVALTPLGVEVVDRYRRELTKGQRIRWPREEG